MCDKCEDQTDSPNIGGPAYGEAGMQAKTNLKASSFRDRLEGRRNSLTRQLAQVEHALSLIYTNPDAEKIHEVLKSTGVL